MNNVETLLSIVATHSFGGKFKQGHDATSKVPTLHHFHAQFITKICQILPHKKGRISLKNCPILKSKCVLETREQALAIDGSILSFYKR